ncbi:MAG: Asp-tRNA(Asn)/Glu-tRNA(Gln) amidotransferase subunit GatC [Cytophagales bacterium]|nr:Asp-tRNA(Asn)/Glu-tRNA(Gln) amidotransferase subunit GatC [Cytophagales bacterium]
MTIDEKLVQDIAHLARLEVAKENEQEMAQELTKILDWMEQLNEVNTDEVEPLIHMSTELNVMREDEEGNILGHEEGLKNAPKKDSNYFRVPKVID